MGKGRHGGLLLRVPSTPGFQTNFCHCHGLLLRIFRVLLESLDHRGHLSYLSPLRHALFLGLPLVFRVPLQLLPLRCLLLHAMGCSLPAPLGGVLRSSGTFSFFSVLLCLAARTCLLLGFFLPCHLGLFGSSLPFLRKGLPESLRIQCCSLQSSYVEPTVPPLAR
jgi:hypothetical protein